IEYGGVKERWRSMKRRRQRPRLQHRGATSRKDERDLVVPADLLLHSEPPIELDEIGTAAQQDVLTVVHNFRGARQLIGGRAPTQIGTPLEQFNLVSGLGQRASCGKTGESAANNGDRRPLRVWLSGAHARRFQNPLLSTASFSAVLKRTRCENTS